MFYLQIMSSDDGLRLEKYTHTHCMANCLIIIRCDKKYYLQIFIIFAHFKLYYYVFLCQLFPYDNLSGYLLICMHRFIGFIVGAACNYIGIDFVCMLSFYAHKH